MNNTTSDNTQEQPSIITDIKKKLSDAKTKLSSIKKAIDDAKINSLIVADIKNILSDFNTKLILILVSLFVLCNAFIMGVIYDYIANGILLGFDDNIAERILFIFVVIVLIYYTVIDIRNNKKVSNSKLEWAFTFLLFWAYYRLLSDEWTYVKFWNINHISYIDIVFVYSISIIIKKSSSIIRKILSIIKKILCNKKDDANIQGFLVDLPIKEEKSDSLIKRDNIAEELATKIKNTLIEDSAFSIGIESPWGEGKTSFINLLCNHFDEKDTVIIQFNPWNYEKERNLVDAFFLELRENLKEYDSSLSTNLTEYARILSDSNHDIIKFGAKFIERFPSQSIEAKRKVINSAIKRINKLILVVIDDLDRLDKDEIMSVLKLIRNSANFSNMVFVSAYDRDYLIETLKDDVCKSNKYLEKIFQYQFKLPEYDKSKLKDILMKEGLKIIKPDDQDEFTGAIKNSDFLGTYTGFIFGYIENIRDVYRFLNAFNLVYQRLHGEVIITDLMNIELLRMKYNYVYELLAKDYNKYLFKDRYGVFTLWDESKKSNYILHNENILEVIKSKYTEEDLKRIKIMLTSMFQPRSDFQPSKAINNNFYIDRYFYYSLLDSDISETEFKYVMKLPYENIKSSIKSWVDKNKSISLSRHIKKYRFSTPEECRKIIESIFYFGYIAKKWSVDIPDIPDIVNCLNSFDKDTEEKKAFLEGVFFENGISVYVVKYINYILDHSGLTWNYIFTEDECNDIIFEMFKLVCKKENNIKTIYEFWSYTRYTKLNEDNNHVLHQKKCGNEKADELFISYIKSHYSLFLPSLIEKGPDHPGYMSDLANKLWKDKERFVSFMNNLYESNKEDKNLKEFYDLIKD